MKNLINVNDVASVYSGKSNTCYCGCAGTYTYNPQHVAYSSKSRGYEVGPEEVNLKRVTSIVRKLNKNIADVHDVDDKIFTLQVGNHDYTVYLKDYSEEKAAAKEQKDTRRENTVALVEKFNAAYPNSTVYLRLTDSDSDSFQVHFRFADQFVDSSIYDRGNAIIYASKELYETVQAIAYTIVPNKKMEWNNTRSIGYFGY